MVKHIGPAKLDPWGVWLDAIGAERAFATLAALLPKSAVFAVDRDRRIVFWSEGAERLLGFSAQEVMGEHCLKANRCETCIVGCGIADHTKLEDVPLTLYNAASKPVAVSKSGRAFFNASGGFIGGVELLSPRQPPSQLPSPLAQLRLPQSTSFHHLRSRDPAMRQVFQVIRNVAETETTVLIRGESGTGKELVAQAMHAESKRAQEPFIAVNCAALTPSLVESELFGHVRGAFTGAVKDRKGLFQQAHRGTLFLDEVAELPLEVQAKLLRVLEEKEVLPVGAARPIRTDVRVLSATHRSLKDSVRLGKFREDLMYRLRVVPIHLPPLRQRPRDIELLLWHFIGQGNERGPRHIAQVAPEAMKALLHYQWPGNIRELRNCTEYVFAVGRGPLLQREELPAEILSATGPIAVVPLTTVLPSAIHPTANATSSAYQKERNTLEQMLRSNGGHIGKTAQMLGISRPTLWRKRKKYGL